MHVSFFSFLALLHGTLWKCCEGDNTSTGSAVPLIALSFGVESKCQGTGVNFKGVCGFVHD